MHSSKHWKHTCTVRLQQGESCIGINARPSLGLQRLIEWNLLISSEQDGAGCVHPRDTIAVTADPSVPHPCCCCRQVADTSLSSMQKKAPEPANHLGGHTCHVSMRPIEVNESWQFQLEAWSVHLNLSYHMRHHSHSGPSQSSHVSACFLAWCHDAAHHSHAGTPRRKQPAHPNN